MTVGLNLVWSLETQGHVSSSWNILKFDITTAKLLYYKRKKTTPQEPKIYNVILKSSLHEVSPPLLSRSHKHTLTLTSFHSPPCCTVDGSTFSPAESETKKAKGMTHRQMVKYASTWSQEQMSMLSLLLWYKGKTYYQIKITSENG